VPRLIVIGGDAGGMSAASQARRLDDKLEIVALERGRHTSYSACGIPYVVGGVVDELDDLVVRRPEEFRDKYRIDARTEHEATAIDLDQGRVEGRNLTTNRPFHLGFDQLLIATGARPKRPDLPGVDLPFVHGVQTLDDGEHLLKHATETRCRDIVVVGGGYIGLEMAEAFVQRGANVILLEAGREVMGTLDPDMGILVNAALRRFGVDVHTGVAIDAFEDGKVRTATGELAADLVVLGTGVVPNSEIAEEAGIELGASRAVRVDHRQRTSADGVWSAGDCCESFHLLTGRWVHIPLGTVANRQGRVAGINLTGGDASFPGVVGTAITRVCRTEVARTGLTQREATDAGFDVEAVTIDSTTRAGYFPGADPVTIKLVGERDTGRLLGAQIVGGDGAAKRIDAAAVAVTAGMTAHDVINLDLSYAPPFSPVWDPLATAARALYRVTAAMAAG
jgi:NADPH-dependent 2,4-dienoyl-CoA reductase/sulfur reductase-like enzyme